MWWLSTECETSGPGVNWIWVRHTGASGEWRVSLDLEVVGVNYGSAQCPKPNRISRALRHCLQQLCMAQTTSAFLPPGTTTADPSSGADQSTLPQPGDDLQLGACSTATAVANVAFPSPYTTRTCLLCPSTAPVAPLPTLATSTYIPGYLSQKYDKKCRTKHTDYNEH